MASDHLEHDASMSQSQSSSEGEETLPILIRTNYRPSFLGKVRTLSNIQPVEWAFIVFSVALLFIGFTFTLFRLTVTDFRSEEFVFGILILINLVFALYYVLHGILQEQPFELLAYIVTSFIIGVLVVINFVSAEDQDYVIRLIRFAVTFLFGIPNVAMAIKIGLRYWESGVYIFKAVGGDRRLQRICRMYLFTLSLMMFDAQAMFSCAILIVNHGFGNVTNEEIYLSVTGAAFAILWLFVGCVALRTENRKATWLFAVISIVQPLYVLYLYVKGIEIITRPYTSRANATFFSGVVLLLVHFTLLAILPSVTKNYRKGLKEAIYGINPAVLRRILQQSSVVPDLSQSSSSRRFQHYSSQSDEDQEAILPAADDD